MTPQAVVFDIGNVLIEWNYEPYMRARFGAERTSRFLEETGIVEVHFRTDAGAPFSETIRAHAANHPDFADMIHAWVDHWLDLCGPVIGGMAEIMADLRARGVPIFALSNFAAENYEWTKEAFPILQGFDREFISGRMMMAKPDPAIYAAVEDATGLRGDELFFTDDRAENIDAARARGWHGHLFTDAPGLRQELSALGLL
ncbi:HAD family hydrolase [Rubricella aquisinus]|nr:HAD family phosphatase [Rubricella aquisinus]